MAQKSNWKIILAFFLDLITGFFVFGYVIAFFTGNISEGGFNLSGAPAVLAIGLLIAYFVVGKRIGGTLWQRVFGI